MKKVLILLISILLFSGNMSAEDKTTNVRYSVDSEYIWEIHTDIDFGADAGINQTVNRTAQISSENTGVKVIKNVIPDGATLNISLTNDNTFTVVNGSTSLRYSVAKTNGGSALSAGDLVLSVESGINTGSQPLYFTLTTTHDAAEVAGVYTGQINYVAKINAPLSFDMPNKGDLIDLGDGKEYKVLSTNGSTAKIVDFTKSPDMRIFDFNSSDWDDFMHTQSVDSIQEKYLDTINGEKVLKYAGSTIDTYFNETYYNNLSANIKNAIVDTNFVNDVYVMENSNSTYVIDSPDHQIDSNNLKFKGFIDCGSRHVGTLRIQDLFDYFETSTISSDDISDLFGIPKYESYDSYYFSTVSPQDYQGGQGITVFTGNEYMSEVGPEYAFNTYPYFAVFTIDLAEIEFTNLSSTTPTYG